MIGLLNPGEENCIKRLGVLKKTPVLQNRYEPTRPQADEWATLTPVLEEKGIIVFITNHYIPRLKGVLKKSVLIINGLFVGNRG